MLWQDAWNQFAETGKISDYMTYANTKASQLGVDTYQRTDVHASNYDGNHHQRKVGWR